MCGTNPYPSTSQCGRAGQCQNRLEEKHQWKNINLKSQVEHLGIAGLLTAFLHKDILWPTGRPILHTCYEAKYLQLGHILVYVGYCNGCVLQRGFDSTNYVTPWEQLMVQHNDIPIRGKLYEEIAFTILPVNCFYRISIQQIQMIEKVMNIWFCMTSSWTTCFPKV